MAIAVYIRVRQTKKKETKKMPNGDLSKVQRAVLNLVYNHRCGVCQQKMNQPFTIDGLILSHDSETKETMAHVTSQRDGGKWTVYNVVPKHAYCNGIDQSVSDYAWIIRRYWQGYVTVEQFDAKREQAANLYQRVLDALHRNANVDADVLTVIREVAQYILSNPDKNAAKRLNGREKILRIASAA